jgi:hypothetical protein
MPTAPKNMIFFIGDGFGPASVTLARVVANRTSLTMDHYFVGTSRTFSSSNTITDSAAGATAFSCAMKTYNAAIAVDDNLVSEFLISINRLTHTHTLSLSSASRQKACGTVLEAAKRKGMATGLVATSRITHATPASFSAHGLCFFGFLDCCTPFHKRFVLTNFLFILIQQVQSQRQRMEIVLARRHFFSSFVLFCFVLFTYLFWFPADRDMEEFIAAQQVKQNVDVMLGGGRKFFDRRSDSINLLEEAGEKGVKVITTLEGVHTPSLSHMHIYSLTHQQNSEISNQHLFWDFLLIRTCTTRLIGKE